MMDVTAIAVCLSLVLDLGFNTLVEPLIAEMGIAITVTIFQVIMPVFTLVLIFVMFMRTRLLQSGNYGAMMSRFRFFSVITPLRITLLLAVKAYRIVEITQYHPWALVWKQQGFLPLFACEKVAMVLYFLASYTTFLQLGDPSLYTQRVAPVEKKPPEFCSMVTQRQLRSVPEIMRGSMTLEVLNRAQRHLNELCIQKYQLLKTEQQELKLLRVSDQAMQARKGWEATDGTDSYNVDCISDADFKLVPELMGETGRDLVQILKHLNMLIAIRTVRSYTLYSNSKRGSEVQEWAAAEAQILRDKTRGSANGGRSAVKRPQRS